MTDRFEEYVAARWAPLVRSAYMLGCQPAEAEDAVQDALFDAWKHWRRVQRAENVDAYVFRILLNRLGRSRRSYLRTHRLTDDAESLETDTRAGKDSQAVLDRVDIRQRLLALPRDQREVVVLKYLLDQPEENIAQILKVPVGTVKSRGHRALASLQSNFAAEGERY